MPGGFTHEELSDTSPIKAISAFPQEHELLFPPLTCLLFKNESVFFHQGIKISVVTVRPFFPS